MDSKNLIHFKMIFLLDQFSDVECGRHEDELHAARVRVDELLGEQHQEVHVLFAVVNLVENDVCPICQTPFTDDHLLQDSGSAIKQQCVWRNIFFVQTYFIANKTTQPRKRTKNNILHCDYDADQCN